MRQRVRLGHLYAIDATRLPGSRRWRRGRASSARVDAIDNVGWDAAPRTEHAVLAAGEALEVAAATHCCRSVFFVMRARLRVVAFCLRIARVVDSLPLDAVLTACRQSQRAKSLAGNSGRMRSSTSAVRSSNRYVRRRVRAPAELVHRGRGMTATPHAMPSNSTALVPKAATCRNPSLNKQSASVQHSR